MSAGQNVHKSYIVAGILESGFFKNKYNTATGMLYGSLVDIVNRSAEITIIAMGMTIQSQPVGKWLAAIGIFLVIYTAGVIMYGSKGFTALRTYMMLFAICVAVSLGLAMGAMVTYLKIPPFVATLTGMFLAQGVCSLISRGSISINNELMDTLAARNVYAIGGVLLSGGVGYMVGTFFGVLLKAVIPSLITFNGTLSSWWGKIITGLLVLLFVALQQVAMTGKLGKKKAKTPTPKIE